MDPRAPDQTLSRHRPQILRPRHRKARRDQRSDHDRFRQRDQGIWRRRQMRDDHPGRSARRGVWPQGNVAFAQRHHPQHPGRRGVSRTDRHFQRPAPDPRLDQADRRRAPRLWRPVSRDRFRRALGGQAAAGLGRREWREDRPRSVRLPRRRRRDGDVQPRRFDPRFRPRVDELWPQPQMAGLSVDQEHHPQGL